MEYKDFYERSLAMQEFKVLRNKLNDAIDNPRGESFSSAFNKIKQEAREGDVVAQDVLAYFYRDGAGRALQEDYVKYMHWEILAGANGNMFAIDKLQFFMGYAYDTIVNHEDFGLMKYKCKIDEYNYLFVIGQKICEELVEKLGITAQQLLEERDRYNPYRPEYFRDLRKAVDNALPQVIEKMKKQA